MPDLQKPLSGTGSSKAIVTEKGSTQAPYEAAPCELSDTDDEDFDLELQYTCMPIASLNDALLK